MPLDPPPVPTLEPMPPEELLPITDWGLSPLPDDEGPGLEEVPPDLNPERILQDPELPRRQTPQPVEPVEASFEEIEEPAPVQPTPVSTREPLRESVSHAPVVASPRQVPSDCPPPPYPPLAVRRGWTGTVVLLIDVAADGSVTGVHIESSSGHRVLDEAAVQAVRGWRFHPGTLDGEAAALVVRKPIRFGV